MKKLTFKIIIILFMIIGLSSCWNNMNENNNNSWIIIENNTNFSWWEITNSWIESESVINSNIEH